MATRSPSKKATSNPKQDDLANYPKPAPTAREKGVKTINIALQGGGAHGAFTWGVLDRLLDEEDIEIHGISGTSAGAMNAAVLIEGYNEGGRARAKAQLKEFWLEISEAASWIAPFGSQLPTDQFAQIPGLSWLSALNPVDMLTRIFSPYESNPLNINPLRTVLERVVKLDTLHKGIHLFVTATNVETGEAQVFRDDEVTIDVLLASACLPFVYQAMQIDGVPYWDGGYSGNPALWPLVYQTDCEDVLLVQINPIERDGTPKTAMDIINRVNEISFNSSLIAEMRAIRFVQRLIESGKLSAKEYADMKMHRVMPPPDFREMNAASKMNANWQFFELLHSVGYRQMDDWLKKHKKDIGHRSTVDIDSHFLAKKGKAKADA